MVETLFQRGSCSHGGRNQIIYLFDFYLLLLFIASSAYGMTDQLCVVLREFRISIECIFFKLVTTVFGATSYVTV